jgi:UDP:flavonoid glycosyltransferase YjiC (YdhE family)
VSRILAYTSPARGHLFPLMPILDELRARGHEIHLRTLAAAVEMARERGFRAEPIDPAIEAIEHRDFEGKNPRDALKIAMHSFLERAKLDGRDLRRAIDRVEPDAIVVDVQAWGGLPAAEAWGGPWASFCPYPLPLPSRDAPPFGPGLPPARGPLGRLRDRILHPIVYGSVRRIVAPPVNEIRAEWGRPEAADDFMTRAPLVLYMTAEPFEYPRRDWPPNVEMVGPCAWDPPSVAPEWLDVVTRPLVLVTTSSEFQDDGRLVRTALDALAHEDVEVVATLPAQDPGAFGDVPANARLLPFVPHAPLLERAAVVVTHGGMGATQKALARGVPVCAVPFGRDQLEVARRVEVSKAGTRVPASKLTPERLRAAVREAIDRRDGARRIAEAYERAGGPRRAADLVEQRLGLAARTPAASSQVP